MRKHLCILGLLGCLGLQAQTGKVGINTETPTEIFDINGTVRVRSLPEEGTAGIYTTGTNTAAANANQTFTPTKFVVADENGVLGVSTTQQLGDIATGSDATNATTDNNSTAMFVKKRYSAGDWPSGIDRNTGFSTDKWDAIITVNKFGRSNSASESTYDHILFQYNNNLSVENNLRDVINQLFNMNNQVYAAIHSGFLPKKEDALQLDLDGSGAYWRVVGDIPKINEAWEFTILFINKKYIASDETRHAY